MKHTDLLSDVSIPSADVQPHLLISTVRQSYLKFLTRLACQNYINWCGEKPPLAVFRCAKQLELSSAAQAMVVPLYRKAVLETVNTLKEATCLKELYPTIEKFCLEPNIHSKAVQTDFVDSHARSLLTNQVRNDSGKYCDNSLQSKEPNTANAKSNDSESNICNIIEHQMNSSNDHKINYDIVFQDDEIMAEMEKIFKQSETENDDDIFDRLECDAHEVQMILNQVNKNVNVNLKQKHENSGNCDQMEVVPQGNNLDIRIDTIVNPVGCSIVSSSQLPPVKKYIYSPWPCEAYYQQKMLWEKLDILCDKNIKAHLKVKEKFVKLFGNDSDDEHGLQSPDTSENFLRSCRQRAAPMFTKHLRKFLEKVRIAKHLTKPLAKHLLYDLISYNQYPTDYECYLFLKEYFKTHPQIKCQADF